MRLRSDNCPLLNWCGRPHKNNGCVSKTSIALDINNIII